MTTRRWLSNRRIVSGTRRQRPSPKFMSNQHEHMAVVSTVLVVEDDWLIRSLIHEILEMEGFEVVTAETGDDAWHWLCETLGGADLLLSDIHLPGGLNGIGLANRVQAHWPRIPVILSSGGKGQQILESGYAPLFIPKPWHSQDIGTICRRALALATPRQ
jgi:DNA-binding NtrC family response regulator